MRLIRWVLFCTLFCWTGSVNAAEVKTQKSSDGWRLMVNGKPFFIKGMDYSPTTIGESSDNHTRRNWMAVDDDHDGRNDFAYQTWVDVDRTNKRSQDVKEVGDFELMHAMGVNAIRLYHHPTSDPGLQKINAIASAELNYTKELTVEKEQKILRDLFSRYHIMVAMGDLLGSYTVGTGASWDAGTDYTDPKQRANMLKSVEEMVKRYKNEPYILMWVLGNENNLQQYTHTNASLNPEAYARFVNQAALLIKKIDGHHPVAIANGADLLLEYYAKYAPAIDVFGLNKYSYGGFYELWSKVGSIYDRPVMLTEFGDLYPVFKNGQHNEALQAKVHRLSWEDISNHRAGKKVPGNSIGGFVFQWVDQWWQGGDPWHQKQNGLAYPGVTSMGDGTGGSLTRQMRKVYWMYKEVWGKD